jgi:DNA uptake protein ComE-like DNA-binding protein
VRRLLTSRYYVPGAVAAIFILLAAILAQMLVRVGQWPSQFARPHQSIIITDPPQPRPPRSGPMVLGAVRSPGMYALARGATVRDLIEAAGGAGSGADFARLSLTAPVSDGQTIYVPRVGEQVPPELGGKGNLNLASADDLHRALGISLTIARRIVAYCTAHGHFTAVSQLQLVPIGLATYERIKDLVAV